MERLQKYLARAGISSRRAAEQLILDGRVKVNGQVVTTLGTKVDGKDLVVMDGAPVVASNDRQWYLFYKPPGVVTTMHDPQGRPTVGEYVERLETRVFPVGRLDYDAEGALLLTDDGETANKLMHPKHQVPRVYLAKVKGSPDDASLEKLRGGVRLEDGLATPKEVTRFEKAEKNTWLKIVVTEGRPHLVKRLCAAIGHPVVRLYRPQHAGIGVEGVKPGEFRALTAEEVKQVKAAGDGRGLADNELRLPARRHGHGAASNDSPARPSGRAMEEEETREESSDDGDDVAEARPRVSTGGRSGVTGPPRARPVAAESDEKGEAKPFRAPRFGGAFKSRDEEKPRGRSAPARGGARGESSGSRGASSSRAGASRGGERSGGFSRGEGSSRGGERSGGFSRGEGASRGGERSEVSSRGGERSERGEGSSRGSERSGGFSRGEGASRGGSSRGAGSSRGESSGSRGASSRGGSRGESTDAPRARPKATEGDAIANFRGRSATGDEGGGSFDTSPSRVDAARGGLHRGTTAGARAAGGQSPAGYRGTGVATGGDRFATRTAVKGAFGNRTGGSKDRGSSRDGAGERRGPPRGGKSGPPRGGGGKGRGR